MEKKLSDGNLLVEALLLRDGCASIKNVLSPETCDSLLNYINNEKLVSEELVESGKVDYDRRFGAVNNRRNRADMFLPYSAPIVQQALHEAVRNMKPFLLSLADMETTGTLHELSCIISDPGAVQWREFLVPTGALQALGEGQKTTTHIDMGHAYTQIHFRCTAEKTKLSYIYTRSASTIHPNRLCCNALHSFFPQAPPPNVCTATRRTSQMWPHCTHFSSPCKTCKTTWATRRTCPRPTHKRHTRFLTRALSKRRS